MHFKESQKQYLNKVVFLMSNSCERKLSAEQSENRKRVLAALSEYAENGVYASDEIEEITPIFRNDRGIYCALGYMLLKSGAKNLADEIASHNNYIDIENIENFEQSALWVWFEKHGIERSEAIIIQRYAPQKGK